MALLWLVCGGLLVLVIALAVKICIMRKSMDEICRCVCDHLSTDTNRLISVSSGDRYVRRLASELSVRLSELRRQRRRYINGDRELKEAVTNISHDLRTPLTAVRGYLDLLEREETSPAVRRYLSLISDRTEALRRLTEELFRYSVISSETELVFQDVDLRSMLEESLLSFYAAFGEKNIYPKISLPSVPVVRRLDSSAFSRILSNIIGNAVKYSDGDFKVSLSEGGEILFENTASDLSNVDVGKLFDRFYTVDSARRSTGLGLSIAKLLTERMGGSISADFADKKLRITVIFEQ